MSITTDGGDGVLPTSKVCQDLSDQPSLGKGIEKPDAGLRSLDHYRNKLPSWRYTPRQKLLPLVRWETPYLAFMQSNMRSPALDSYFSITANLGTHTFFMVFLPILFWCGHTSLARAMVHMLATGVFFSGVLKDFLCIPRPLSPPLHRITMSSSAALEYGFPSTHSTNAVSVTAYTLLLLDSPTSTMNPQIKFLLEVLLYCYAASIILGRLYCGMHGFLDVIIGGLLGALLSVIEFNYGETFDEFITGSIEAPVIVILIICVLVRIHPEPVDDCPCFDDSVAFAGVMIGIELGHWHYIRSDFEGEIPVPVTAPFELDALGWAKTVARIVVGVLTVFTWRAIMKPALLRTLPPIFRIVERLGLSLPRRYFVQASEYKKIPKHLKDDNVIPSVSEIPSLFTSIRHPRRSPSVSLGPQSEADAYETLAYRERRRKESISKMVAASPTLTENGTNFTDKIGCIGMTTSNSATSQPPTPGVLPTPVPSMVERYQDILGAETNLPSYLAPGSALNKDGTSNRSASTERRQYEWEEREIFSKLEKPRVRYDVEVITKIIVYTGIGWIAAEGGILLFELLGLGLAKKAG